jgi:translocation and assembly module TamB
MRRFRYLLVALVGLLLLGGVTLWQLSQTDVFWRWGGQRLVDFAQSRIYGEVKVRAVRGTPLTGLSFDGVTVVGRQGEILRADRVELRFSLWSFLKLQPVIAKLAIYAPRLQLSQDDRGTWNVSGLLRPKPPPPFDSIDFSQITIEDGAVDLSRPEGSRTYTELNLQTSLTVHHPKRPQQVISISRAQMQVTTPQGRFGLEGACTYRREGLELKSLVLAAADRPLLTLTGGVRLPEGSPEIDLTAELGPALADEFRRLRPEGLALLDLRGKFHLTGAPAALLISGTGGLEKGTYALEGKVSRESAGWTYDLTLNLTDLQPQGLAPAASAWEQRLQGAGPLTARWQLRGEGLQWPPAKMELTCKSGPFRYRQVQVEGLELALHGGPQEQLLEGLVRGNFGQLKVNAAGSLLSSPAGEVRLQLEGFQPAALDLKELAESLLQGKFSGNFRWPDNFQVSGDLEVKGRLLQQPLQELRGRLSWDGARLAVSQAQVRLGSLTGEVKGSLESKGLDLQGRVTLAADGSWAWLPQDLRGRLEGEGSLKGPLGAPHLTWQGKGRDLSGGGLAAASLTFKADSAGWPPASGHLEVQGAGVKTPVGTFSQALLSSQGESGRWRFTFKASSPDGPQAEMAGAADLKGRPMALLLERCRLQIPGFTGYNTAPVQIRLIPGWEVSPATFRLNEGYLSFQGQARAGHLSGRLEVGDLPTEPLCIKGSPCQGKMKGQLTLSGDPLNPVIQGQFLWGPGKWGELSFRALQTSLSYQDSRLTLSGSLEEGASGPRLTWEGKVPLQLSLSPVKWVLGDQDLQIRVRGEKANLALLTALSPGVQGAEGTLDIMAEWQGNPHHPKVSGQVRWGAGFVNLRAGGVPYRLQPGQARLEGERLVISEALLESGGGSARVSGSITLDGFFPQQLDVRAQLQDFLALRRGGTEAKGTGSVTLSGPWSAPILKGRLLTKATFASTFFQSDKHEDVILVGRAASPEPTGKPVPAPAVAFYKNLQMDVVLEAPKGDVWLRDKRLNVEMAGLVKATKKPGQPTYWAGEVQAVKGTYEIQGKNFKIVKGVIHLPGTPKTDVTMEGRATYEMRDLTLIVDANGAIAKPTVRMESIPPLPPEDMLAYLVFGRPSSKLTREESLTVGQQAAGILGGVTAEKLKELLGKDFPLVGNVTMRNSQTESRKAVGLAKPITEDLTLSFERKFDPLHRDNAEQAVLEYKVNKYFSLESQMGRRNTGADVLFNLDF